MLMMRMRMTTTTQRQQQRTTINTTRTHAYTRKCIRQAREEEEEEKSGSILCINNNTHLSSLLNGSWYHTQTQTRTQECVRLYTHTDTQTPCLNFIQCGYIRLKSSLSLSLSIGRNFLFVPYYSVCLCTHISLPLKIEHFVVVIIAWNIDGIALVLLVYSSHAAIDVSYSLFAISHSQSPFLLAALSLCLSPLTFQYYSDERIPKPKPHHEIIEIFMLTSVTQKFVTFNLQSIDVPQWLNWLEFRDLIWIDYTPTDLFIRQANK